MEAVAESAAVAGTVPSIISIASTALIKAGRRNLLVVASMYIPQFHASAKLRNQSLLSQTLEIVTRDLRIDYLPLGQSLRTRHKGKLTGFTASEFAATKRPPHGTRLRIRTPLFLG
jgi:hypothetical protein